MLAPLKLAVVPALVPARVRLPLAARVRAVLLVAAIWRLPWAPS